MQACQKSSGYSHNHQHIDLPEDDETDAAGASPTTDITLNRDNVVTLHATVSDGYAYRGVFTEALAEQFRKSDGKTDIYEMFVAAKGSVPRSKQLPKMETTLGKKLFLPVADRPV